MYSTSSRDGAETEREGKKGKSSIERLSSKVHLRLKEKKKSISCDPFKSLSDCSRQLESERASI